MKIVFTLFRYFPFGGLQKDMLRIANTCEELGHEVTIIAGEWSGDKPSNAAVKVLPIKGRSNHRRAQSFVSLFNQWLEDNPQDQVVGFNRMPGLDFYYGADSCFMAKTAEKHNALVRLLPRYKIFTEYEQAVFSQGSATQLLMISPKEIEVYRHCYQTETERFHLLPPGISRDRVATDNALTLREKFRSQHKLADDDVLFLMVGSGFATKGVDRSIDAIGSLPQEIKSKAKLWIVGADNSEPYCQQIKSLGLNNQVSFFGGRDDVPEFLLGADILLHPAYRENTGTVLLEAMVSGLPVIASDVCGYAHYIQEAKMGAVLPSPYDPLDMQKSIINLLQENRQHWLDLGKSFSSTADIYSLHENAAALITQEDS